MAQVWRRSLQLRVVVLTLGLSLAVILVLGFVLTSQITNRVLDVKVRAAPVSGQSSPAPAATSASPAIKIVNTITVREVFIAVLLMTPSPQCVRRQG